MSSETTEIALDISGLSTKDVHARIRTIDATDPSPKRLRLLGANHHHNLLTATPSLSISIEGDVGDYCAAALKDADIDIQGNAGAGVGHSLQSGVISVRKNAGMAAGAMASGGLIIVHGNAGPRCGAGLQGADIVVEGSVESHAGAFMRDGTLVILGTVGALAGYGAVSGTWFVLGEITGNAPALVESRMKEPDKLRLGLLLLNSGVDASVKDFRKYVIENTASPA